MDEALEYFINKGWSYWRLEQGTKRLDFHDGEDMEKATQDLTRHLNLLVPGAYTLKVRPSHKADAGQTQIDFIKARIPKTPINTMQSQQSIIEQIEQARQQGIIEGEKKATIEFRLVALEKAVNDLREQLAKLFNDDDDDDAPALAKISEIASQMPGLMAGLNAIKGK